MFLEAERRRFEAVQIVTGRALPCVITFGELTAVRIGRVAVGALGECQRFLEVALSMTEHAIHGLVLADQWIFGFGVVKALRESGGLHALPTASGVTGLAALLLEAAVMRIAVAIRALAKLQACPSRLVIDPRGMALLARDFFVQSGQRISRLGVIEL